MSGLRCCQRGENRSEQRQMFVLSWNRVYNRCCRSHDVHGRGRTWVRSMRGERDLPDMFRQRLHRALKEKNRFLCICYFQILKIMAVISVEHKILAMNFKRLLTTGMRSIWIAWLIRRKNNIINYLAYHHKKSCL